MSVPDAPPPNGADPAARRAIGGFLAALLILIGIVLLLPGLCSLFFVTAFLSGKGSAGGLGVLWLITFVVAAGGILLIRYAWRNR
jgi:hypothetical protein